MKKLLIVLLAVFTAFFFFACDPAPTGEFTVSEGTHTGVDTFTGDGGYDEGATVTIEVTPASGYAGEPAITVTGDDSSDDIALASGPTESGSSWEATFTMPAENVTVVVVFNEEGSGGSAVVVLDVQMDWGDGTGYQMLMDSTASTYGTTIPESGNLMTDVYGEFDYKIPENADFAGNNILMIEEVEQLEVPAGTYDYCVANPYPVGGMVYIAAGNDARGDDLVLEEGKTYTFTVTQSGQNDLVTLTIADTE